jgi:hypothetical protein
MKLLIEELNLLIKSKYPVIFLESIDEEYVLNQLYRLTSELKLNYYEWSISEGLRKGRRENPFYRTQDPVLMLKTIFDLIRSNSVQPLSASMVVLKDFASHLENVVVLRLFKDLINKIKNTRNTVVIVAASYKLPTDIEPFATHIVGGYPSQTEIIGIIKETIEEFRRSGKTVSCTLDKTGTNTVLKLLAGLSIQQIRNTITQSLLDDYKLNNETIGRIEKFKKEIFDKEGLLEFYISEDRVNIADFDNLKRWLEERKHSFQAPTFVLPPPKGILLMGVQGCGKSLAIKVIARELSLPLYRLDVGKLYSKYIGETEENLRKSLSTVEKLSPLCLWIDEIEKCFAASGSEIDGGVSQRVMATFLTWMQERKSDCFLAATANNIYMLPPEFLRKGRFDEIFFVDLPDLNMRKEVFKIHLAKRRLDPVNFDCELLAEKSADFNGAEIEQAVLSALYRATSKQQSITTEHIIEQLESTRPLAVIRSEDVIALREWARERTVPV